MVKETLTLTGFVLHVNEQEDTVTPEEVKSAEPEATLAGFVPVQEKEVEYPVGSS